MTERELFKESFSHLHASPDTITEVLNMAKHENIPSIHTERRRHPARRLIAVVAVAALLVTGAVAAGTALYKMNSEPIGEYGLSLMVDFADSSASVAVSQTPVLDITPGWLPEGMVLNAGETTKYSYETTPFLGGFSIGTAVLNTGSETFCETVTDMESRESLTVNGHEAEYVKLFSLEDGSIHFDQRLYIACPEYNQVICIYIGEDMDKATAVKFAENLILSESGGYISQEVMDYHGELYAEARESARTAEAPAESGHLLEELFAPKTDRTATAADMANLHRIGESFEKTVYQEWSDERVPVTLKVTEVTVGDDANIFGEGFQDSDIAGRLEEDGRAPVNTIQFVKQGDGIHSLTEVVEEREEASRLVAVTFEVTNPTDETMEHVHFNASYLTLVETAEGYAIWEPAPEGDAEYDYVSMSRVPGDHGMRYFSVRDDYGNGGNYIPSLAPGETVSVQVGFLVSESQLDKLFLNLDGTGNGSSFEEYALGIGYVDIRQ